MPAEHSGTTAVAASLAELAAATARLADTLRSVTDDDVAAPSLLPGWTRGHALTHLARNAEGGVRLLGWARTGVPSAEYDSPDARAAAIEEGAGRPAAVLVEDVRTTADAFHAATATMPPTGWTRTVRYTSGRQVPAATVVTSRLAEVLVHHVDLDLGFGPGDWPADFVRARLASVTASLTARDLVHPSAVLRAADTGDSYEIGHPTTGSLVISGPQAGLMAWLYGRSDGGSLDREPELELPRIPALY